MYKMEEQAHSMVLGPAGSVWAQDGPKPHGHTRASWGGDRRGECGCQIYLKVISNTFL